MVPFLFKWLMVGGLVFTQPAATHHPIFVSVTEIEHNTKDKTLEISCKIFTDDFEKTLRKTYTGYVDLLKPRDKNAMNKIVAEYVQKHLLIKIDGKTVGLQFIGYEQEEEGVISYYQVNNIPSIKKVDITDNILFEYKKEQMNIIHLTVHGEKQSTRLNNPQETVSFAF
ncbi:MAG: hypothetical protein IPL84_18340 [Chitinophagaceae bacterium]|nr:hypothetical protein [Chitinophagaceae bacterium]